MRKKTLIRSFAAAVAVVGLAIGGVTVAGTASAVDDIGLGRLPYLPFEERSLAATPGAVVSFEFFNTSKAATWNLQIKDGMYNHAWSWNALTNDRRTYKKSGDAANDRVRLAVAAGYTEDRVVTVAQIEDIAINALWDPHGFASKGVLSVDARTRDLIWTMTIEQGDVRPVVVIDVGRQRVMSVTYPKGYRFY